MLTIRPEQVRDREAVRIVNERAFGGPAEADLIDALRNGGKVSHSLVAELGGRVVGHILFSPVTIEPDGGAGGTLGLGPMAVLSTFGVRCEFDVPDEVFMALPLAKGAFDAVSGVARYQPEFGSGAQGGS